MYACMYVCTGMPCENLEKSKWRERNVEREENACEMRPTNAFQENY
jgi:hypothetical protein